MRATAAGPTSTGAAVAGGALATVVAGRLLDRRPPLGAGRWSRTNYAGEPVTLLEGPAVVLGSGVAALGLGAPVAAFAALAAGALGALDDLIGDASSKGLGGHLAALCRGRVTTGAVKVLGLGGTGLLVALAGPAARGVRAGTRPLVADRGGRRDVTHILEAGQVLVDAGVVAGSANLVNLLDLRPGRALKATLLLGAPLAVSGSRPAAVVVGSALAALPRDLAGQAMLGDTGANALGALLGSAAVVRLPRPARWAVFTGLVVLTLASERVSFTAVIDRTPVLRAIDRWGRRSPHPGGGSR